VAEARFTPRTSALWLRRATVLPGATLVGMVLWLNALAPMRMVDLIGMLCVAGAWVGLVLWSILHSPPVELYEHGLRIQSAELIPWTEVVLEQERVNRLDLRAGSRRLTIQPSLYAQPEALRRFVIHHVQGGVSKALEPDEHRRQTRRLVASGVAAALGSALGAVLLGRACAM